MSKTTCRSCDAPIMFISGYKGPVDPTPLLVVPHRAGDRLTVVVADVGVVPQVQLAAPGEPGRVGYRSHFASCPNANAHRKPREGGARKPRFDPSPRPAPTTGDLFPARPFTGGSDAH